MKSLTKITKLIFATLFVVASFSFPPLNAGRDESTEYFGDENFSITTRTLSSKEFQKLKEEYPDWAKAVEKKEAENAARLEGLIPMLKILAKEVTLSVAVFILENL